MYTSEADELLDPNNTDDGVETESEDLNDIEIKRPFNPEKIKVRTVNIVVQQLVSRIRHNEIDLSPDFQRMRGIWTPHRKSRLIESLLLRIPIPVFYVSADYDENWAVVDGVQRMSTIFDYVKGEISLSGLEYLIELKGKSYDNLPRNMQRRISETQLVVNVIEPGTPVEVMFNIFHRINTGGMTLNGQEIRHALNPGPIRSYLKRLAETEEFLTATDYSIKKKRMADRECVLRFLAFYIKPWKNYDHSDLDGYLIDAMKRLNQMNQRDLDILEIDFKNAMQAAKEIFDNNTFRKTTHTSLRRNPINKALLEAWGVGLAQCSPEQIEILIRKREDVQNRFMEILNSDREFLDAVSTSTGSPQRVRKRFGDIENLIQELL